MNAGKLIRRDTTDFGIMRIAVSSHLIERLADDIITARAPVARHLLSNKWVVSWINIVSPYIDRELARRARRRGIKNPHPAFRMGRFTFAGKITVFRGGPIDERGQGD